VYSGTERRSTDLDVFLQPSTRISSYPIVPTTILVPIAFIHTCAFLYPHYPPQMMSSLPSRTDPGAILIFLKPNKLDRVIQEGTANLIATLSSFLPGIGCATYYRAADPVYEKQHLILCQVGNSLSFDSKALESILQERGGQVEFDVRIFRQVQIFGPYSMPSPTLSHHIFCIGNQVH
jgi:hypothetical protein